MANSLATVNEKRPTFTAFLGSVNVQKSLNNVFRDSKECSKFVSSIASAVSANPSLQECDYGSIVSAGLLANALKLSLSPQLGFCYIVPFKDNKNKRTVAQFMLSYRGFLQLAIRSGYYKRINAIEIKQGELVRYNALTEELFVNLIQDEEERVKAPTVGYFACFELLNGFTKTLYWTKGQMLIYADKYSPAFSKDGEIVHTRYGDKKKVSYESFITGDYEKDDAWLYSSFWYQNFDEMALKTMIKQLIRKWGIMSIDLEKAFESDSDGTDGNVDVVDAPAPTTQEIPPEQKNEQIEPSKQNGQAEPPKENVNLETGEIEAVENFDFFDE